VSAESGSAGAPGAPAAQRSWRRPSPAAVIAAFAVAIAIIGWLFPRHGDLWGSPHTEGQANDAKQRVCESFTAVNRAVVTNSHLQNPPNGGPVGALSVQTAARLAFYGGGAFLRDQVSQNPATPTDLAQSANTVGTALEELSVGYMAGNPDAGQDEARQRLTQKIAATAELCKK